MYSFKCVIGVRNNTNPTDSGKVYDCVEMMVKGKCENERGSNYFTLEARVIGQKSIVGSDLDDVAEMEYRRRHGLPLTPPKEGRKAAEIAT